MQHEKTLTDCARTLAISRHQHNLCSNVKSSSVLLLIDKKSSAYVFFPSSLNLLEKIDRKNNAIREEERSKQKHQSVYRCR
jgi:hypothetical protein